MRVCGCVDAQVRTCESAGVRKCSRAKCASAHVLGYTAGGRALGHVGTCACAPAHLAPAHLRTRLLSTCAPAHVRTLTVTWLQRDTKLDRKSEQREPSAEFEHLTRAAR